MVEWVSSQKELALRIAGSGQLYSHTPLARSDTSCVPFWEKTTLRNESKAFVSQKLDRCKASYRIEKLAPAIASISLIFVAKMYGQEYYTSETFIPPKPG